MDAQRRARMTLMLAMAAAGVHMPPPVPRCDPRIDDDSPKDATAGCRKCGRRLRLDEIMEPPVCGKRAPQTPDGAGA